ncbi:hypothetical protein CANCADRAFT_17352, partial [Tortispora caseinolytica NRRL Y-17796]
VKVLYCGVCTLPVEYCEFGATLKKCKAWLQSNDPTEYAALYESGIGALSLNDDGNDDEAVAASVEKSKRDIAKRQAKEEAKEELEQSKLKHMQIFIKTNDRNKRKTITSIYGALEVMADKSDLKKLAKTFAGKFATGSSLGKTTEGTPEISIQGDVADAVEAYLRDQLDAKGLQDVKIARVVDKKK